MTETRTSSENDEWRAKMGDIDWLQEAELSDLRLAILAYTVRPDTSMLDAIRKSNVASKVRSAAVAAKSELEGRLSEMAAESSAFQQTCHHEGRSGKQKWFDFQAEYERDRSRLVRRKAAVDGILSGLKKTSPAASEKAVRSELAAYQLIEGIAEHRASLPIEESSGEDASLWELLSTVQVMEDGGMISAEDLLSRIGLQGIRGRIEKNIRQLAGER